MRPPRSIIGTIAALPLLRSFGRRAAIFGPILAVATVLSFYPERYRAAETLTPADPATLGLSGTLGQLGAANSVFGSQAAVEVALRVANSVYARDVVIKQLNLQQRMGKDRLELQRWLSHAVDIRSLRGGIIQMEMDDRDPVLARDIVNAFGQAIKDRLAVISRTQTAYKRDVLVQLVQDASKQLAEAQGHYDAFRMTNRAPLPTVTVQTVSQRIPSLEAAIKVKEIEKASAQQMYGPDNPMMRQQEAEVEALKRQLAEVRASSPTDEVSVGRAIDTSSKLFKLERDLTIARTLYDNYLRYLQGTTAEDMTSTANVRILEPAFIDTDRQVRWSMVALAGACLLLWLAIEFYRLRPPVGVHFDQEEKHV
jgi:tyrosine-protein kinase Etk/Wzc